MMFRMVACSLLSSLKDKFCSQKRYEKNLKHRFHPNGVFYFKRIYFSHNWFQGNALAHSFKRRLNVVSTKDALIEFSINHTYCISN